MNKGQRTIACLLAVIVAMMGWNVLKLESSAQAQVRSAEEAVAFWSADQLHVFRMWSDGRVERGRIVRRDGPTGLKEDAVVWTLLEE